MTEKIIKDKLKKLESQKKKLTKELTKVQKIKTPKKVVCKHLNTKWLDSPCASFERCEDCGKFIHGVVLSGAALVRGIKVIKSSF